MAPALLLELKRMAGDSLPAADGPTFIAQRDGGAIAQELEQMLARRCSLPEYAPLAGGLFALLRVQCLDCGTHRLAFAHTRSTCALIHSGYHICKRVV